MNRFLFSLLTFVVSGFALGQSKQGPVVADEKITAAVNSAVDGLLAEKKVAGAVSLVAQGGKIRHLQAHGKPVATDTIFRIHSMTKAIVSAAALQQLEAGKYELSDPVSKFIPGFSKYPTMTVEDLFRHTSGLAYNFTAPEQLVKPYSSPKLWGGDLERFCNELVEIPLVHEPGKSWTYGVGIDVLGRLVEIWSGKPLDIYLADEFFKPLGMKDTGFWIEDPAKKSRFATVFKSSSTGVVAGGDPLGQKYLDKPKLLSGGGGLTSTVSDYYEFLQMIADGGTRNGHVFLKPETVALMTGNQLPDKIPNIFFGEEQRTNVGFGLGFSVVMEKSADWDKAARVGEFGWGGAASCHYWVSPADDNLIVITLEQTVPYNWNLELALKPVIYKAIAK